jgi:hypothetical protein
MFVHADDFSSLNVSKKPADQIIGFDMRTGRNRPTWYIGECSSALGTSATSSSSPHSCHLLVQAQGVGA